MKNLFYCPICKKDVVNFDESCCLQNNDEKVNLPILIDNFSVIEKKLVELRESKKSWYNHTHLSYLNGPFKFSIMERIDFLKSALNKYNLTKNMSLLDIGCGDGFNLTWLRHHFENLYGSDYNLLRALRAKGLEHAKVVVADITKYPAYNESFDVVFFNHVLEHIPNDKKALEEVYRITKKNGTCILGIPNEGAVFWKLAYSLEYESKKNTDHVHFYTAKSAKKLCESVGFKVLETKYIGYGIPHWTFDSLLRQKKMIYKVLNFIGKIFFPKQATSLYLILRK